MRTHSPLGGRHELGQNFLIHQPTLARISTLAAATDGAILEIAAGNGAITGELARLGRDLTAIDIDERCLAVLRQRFPAVRVERGDVLRHPLDRPVIVGNVPYHLTTPILRRLLGRPAWQVAILLTQWEVARKRAGVGGGTLMSAQAAPWFAFELHARVPARGFRPVPSVDGGLLRIERRSSPLVPLSHRRDYERFVKSVFTGQGRGLAMIVQRIGGMTRIGAARTLDDCGIDPKALPRDLAPGQWVQLWEGLGSRGRDRRSSSPGVSNRPSGSRGRGSEG